MTKRYVPCTPAGTVLFHLEASTENEAWRKLIMEASHMPYKTRENFEKRGYEVCSYDEDESEEDDES